MVGKELIERSPIRALERSLRGGLGPGKLGVVLARSGVGKTACLVQIALDALMRGQRVLHVSNEAPVDHLRCYYDELFHELERHIGWADASSALLELERRRLLISQPGPEVRLTKLNEAVSLARDALGHDPNVVVIEGFDFESASEAQVDALREMAAGLGAELWLSVRTHRHDPVTHPKGYPRPVAAFESRVDVMVALHPVAGEVHLHVLKSHDAEVEQAEPLVLDAVTMRLVEEQQRTSGAYRRIRERFLLHSGGARGAEAAFGEMAERYGIREVTFSFEGHTNRVRSRGLRILRDHDLRLGDVSLRYVSRRLGREFPSEPALRRVLQSIWHQVRPCRQVFIIGLIQKDGTVRGGTGWGAELARRWGKELDVFDQSEGRWFQLKKDSWEPVEPIITAPMFAGSGTARPEPPALRAIEQLFERSFSP